MPKTKRPKITAVTWTEEEYTIISQAAKGRGLSVAAYLRTMALQAATNIRETERRERT